MSHKDGVCLYDKTHTIPVFDKNKEIEERSLNITIININDILQIKVRDPLEYCFNYTENVDLGDFEIMRVNQNLDINFNEFKYNLIEMLQQFQNKEMFLKCEISSQKCTLIFFYKSKIKSIIYLTIDLQITNQKEIFSELITNMQNVQDTNERLKKQLSNIRKSDNEKDAKIQQLVISKNELEAQIHKVLKRLSDTFNMKIRDTETLLTNRVVLTQQRIMKLLKEVDLLKKGINRKAESNRNLVKSMENLRMETNDNLALISNLKKENNALFTAKFNQEKYVSDIQKNLHEKDILLADLQKKNSELQSDMEKMTVLMAQKKATIDELSKDLVQANQMLVNFNNHYDNKSKQVEELQATLLLKDTTIREQGIKSNEILREFDNYKALFNKEGQENLKHEIFLANNKIEELEKTLRKANKINTLLTEKINNPSFPR